MARRAEKLEATNGRVEARTVTAAIETFGKLDILAQQRWDRHGRAGHSGDPEESRKAQDINVNGSYSFAQACGRMMQPGSSIINVSGVLGFVSAGLPQAASSKAATIGLTRDLSEQ